MLNALEILTIEEERMKVAIGINDVRKNKKPRASTNKGSEE